MDRQLYNKVWKEEDLPFDQHELLKLLLLKSSRSASWVQTKTKEGGIPHVRGLRNNSRSYSYPRIAITLTEKEILHNASLGLFELDLPMQEKDLQIDKSIKEKTHSFTQPSLLDENFPTLEARVIEVMERLNASSVSTGRVLSEYLKKIDQGNDIARFAADDITSLLKRIAVAVESNTSWDYTQLKVNTGLGEEHDNA